MIVTRMTDEEKQASICNDVLDLMAWAVVRADELDQLAKRYQDGKRKITSVDFARKCAIDRELLLMVTNAAFLDAGLEIPDEVWAACQRARRCP